MDNNKFALLIGGIVVSLLVCYYLNRELSTTRTRVSDVERAVTMHNKAFESLQNDIGGADIEEETADEAKEE